MSRQLKSQKEAFSLTPAWLKVLDHTADAGLLITAGDLPELFSRAAWAMFSLVTDLEAVRSLRLSRVTVTAMDREALLVQWLSELNYRHITQHLLFAEFKILDWREQQLTAEISGEPIDPDRHTVHTEIKAVTFHGLNIKPVVEGWQAQIIFDL